MKWQVADVFFFFFLGGGGGFLRSFYRIFCKVDEMMLR